MIQPTNPTKLDLWHKGIYPALATAITFFGVSFAVFVYWSNNDKQWQIDRLRSEIQGIREQAQAAERKHEDQAQRAEEYALKTRVEICKAVLPHGAESGYSELELVWPKWFVLLSGALERYDAQRLGEDKAKELWKKARQEADNEMKVDKSRPNRLGYYVTRPSENAIQQFILNIDRCKCPLNGIGGLTSVSSVSFQANPARPVVAQENLLLGDDAQIATRLFRRLPFRNRPTLPTLPVVAAKKIGIRRFRRRG